MSYHQVVQRLRAGGASTRLIVVDANNKVSTDLLLDISVMLTSHKESGVGADGEF